MQNPQLFGKQVTVYSNGVPLALWGNVQGHCGVIWCTRDFSEIGLPKTLLLQIAAKICQTSSELSSQWPSQNRLRDF